MKDNMNVIESLDETGEVIRVDVDNSIQADERTATVVCFTAQETAEQLRKYPAKIVRPGLLEKFPLKN